MPREIVLASKEGRPQVRFRLEVFPEGDHWTSTLVRLDEGGGSQAVAPRFYGFTEDQARRRMLAVLENEYDEIVRMPEAPAEG